MARLVALAEGITLSTSWGVARDIAGAIAADSATLTDANIPAAGGIDCSGYDTILVSLEITAGTNPGATFEALFRDAEAPDGERWKRILLGAAPGVTATALAAPTTGALVAGQAAELRVFGHPLVFLRVTAVANSASTTNMKVLVRGGAPRAKTRRV